MGVNRITKIIMVAAAISLAGAVSSYALPKVNEVVSGDVSIEVKDGIATYNVSSNKAIINFDEFNISANEQVHFNGPSSEVLARVTGGNASYIDGTLT